MKILFNCQTTTGQKTGVGHYSHQLLANLRTIPDCEVTGFPSERWLNLEQHAHGWYRGLRSSMEFFRKRQSVGPSVHLGDSKGWISTRLRQWRSQWMERMHAQYSTSNRFQIYHEPNHVPYASPITTVTSILDLSVLLHPEWHPADRVNWFTQNLPRTMKQSTHFITISDFTKRQMTEILGIAPEKVTRVYIGIRPECRPVPPTEYASVLAQLKLPANYLLYVGTIEPRKNVLRLMQAYCMLPSALRSACPLILVGRWGWHTECELAYYTSVGKHSGVIHLGYVPDENLPAIYSAARALVYPSFFEGFGLPVVEMFACGGAVITSTAEAIVEVAGGRAHCVEAEDTEGWRDAMQRVILDTDWQQTLRGNHQEAADQYSWRRCAEETAQVYRNILRPSEFKRIRPIHEHSVLSPPRA